MKTSVQPGTSDLEAEDRDLGTDQGVEDAVARHVELGALTVRQLDGQPPGLVAVAPGRAGHSVDDRSGRLHDRHRHADAHQVLRRTVAARLAQHVADAPLGHDLAVVHDHDVVADVLDLREQVAAQHDARRTLAGDPLDKREQLCLTARVKPERGLVQEHDTGVVDQRPSDAESLAHAVAVRVDQRGTPSSEPDVVQQPLGDLACLGARPTVELPEIGQVLGSRRVPREPQALGKNADAAADPIGLLRTDPVDLKPAGCRFEDGREDTDRRGLARSIGTQEPEDPSWPQRERERSQGSTRPIRAIEIVGYEDRLGGRRRETQIAGLHRAPSCAVTGNRTSKRSRGWAPRKFIKA